MLAEMRERGFVYDGRLPPPKGEVPVDWEDSEQTLCRTCGSDEGAGKISCPECDDASEEPCPACGGMGTIACPDC